MLGNVITEIENVISHFNACNIQYANCMCNTAAHRLARNIWHVDDILLWYDSTPNFLEWSIWFDGYNL